jgi:hypothetical protein
MDIDLSVLDIRKLLVETDEQYNSGNACFLTSQQLAMFRRCPWHYRKHTCGLLSDENEYDIPDPVPNAAHVRILEGRDVYESKYRFTIETTAQTAHKIYLGHGRVDLVENIAAGVAMNDEAVGLLLFGRACGVVRCEYGGVPCQARIDWVHPHHGIVEYEVVNDLKWFESDVRRQQLCHHAAFLHGLCAEYAGNSPSKIPFHFVASERCEPYRCGVWKVTEDVLAIARRENEAAIRRMSECHMNDHWPTEYEEIRKLDWL